VDELSAQFGVPIVLAPKKLEEAGINVEVPVSKRLESLPLESILDIVLDEMELDYTIRNDLILVSTPEHLESPDMMEIRIYPVRDLVLRRATGSKDQPNSFEADYDALIDVITTSVAPESWSDVGGPGSIREFDSSAALIVSQTRRVHRQIERLLSTLRTVKDHQVITSKSGTTSTSLPSGRRRIAGRPPARTTPRASASAPLTWQIPQVYGD
jgi:hypothetical protein